MFFGAEKLEGIRVFHFPAILAQGTKRPLYSGSSARIENGCHFTGWEWKTERSSMK